MTPGTAGSVPGGTTPTSPSGQVIHPSGSSAPPPRILIADDERGLREALLRFFRSIHMSAEGVANGEDALRKLNDASWSCDLFLCDLGLPDIDGLTLLAESKRRRPHLPVVILTGHVSVTLAVDAMRAGAANFLVKPVDVADLEQAVRAALKAPEPERTRGTLVAGGPAHTRSGEVFIGESAPAEAMRALTRRVAASEASVLITGESGAGKEVVARSIHAQSRRAAAPFVALNCGAIPEALLESELFGHVRGAFTGATHSREGRFTAAAGGTLLLDEIGELPLQMQVKLLRVLQERAFTPVGGTEPQPLTARILAATNRDLESMVAAGQFREDLFYRLNVLSIVVPPLRERRNDILQLASTFLRRAAAAEGKVVSAFDEDVTRCLLRYTWPGNVRELEHAITRATVMATDETLSLADLPVRVRATYTPVDEDAVTPPPELIEPDRAARPALVPDEDTVPAQIVTITLGEDGIDLMATLEQLERRLILEALRRTGGNKNRAAALLRLRRTTLIEKLKRMGRTDDADEP
jgi:DNA-binding NtrC family response regulator